MAIYLTGDTHGDFNRFSMRLFPEQKSLTREDYVIILGDFGGLWDGSERDLHELDILEQRSFTTLFLDGNHENYDLLASYPHTSWHGGLVQQIRPHILHLCRGQVYTLQGKTFFTMGGASSHDMDGGILDPADTNWKQKARILRRRGLSYRVRHQSWWEEELPASEEYETARQRLEEIHGQADYVLTHCAPDSIQQEILGAAAKSDTLTTFLEEISQRISCTGWYFGHYHEEGVYRGRYHLLYKTIQQIC